MGSWASSAVRFAGSLCAVVALLSAPAVWHSPPSDASPPPGPVLSTGAGVLKAELRSQGIVRPGTVNVTHEQETVHIVLQHERDGAEFELFLAELGGKTGTWPTESPYRLFTVLAINTAAPGEDPAIHQELAQETASPDRILQMEKLSWQSRQVPGQRGILLSVIEDPPAFMAMHLDRDALQERLRRLKADPKDVVPYKRAWGYLVPLRTREEGLVAAQILHMYLTGHTQSEHEVLGMESDPIWTPVAADMTFDWRAAAASPTARTAHIAVSLVALAMWVGYALWVRRTLRRYWRRVEGPVPSPLSFALTPARRQQDLLAALEARLQAFERRELEQAHEQERRERLEARRADEAERRASAPDRAEPSPPTKEEVRARVEAVTSRTNDPSIPGDVRAAVRSELQKALEQKSTRRATRILDHAEALIEDASRKDAR